MIKTTSLQKVYGNLEVLKDINLEIDRGDIYGLVGVSGAGKSTLLRCINGLENYQGGSVKVNGVEVNCLNKNELKRFRSNIGMIFQGFSLLERKTVYENIALPMKCWNYDKSEIDKRVRELARLVELEEKLNSRPKELSGGQKQRVAIARALTLNPEILLCDEATSALDPNITKSILALLRKINKNLGITILVVTHQMSVVKQICNKIAILSQGKLKANGKVEDIFIEKPPVLEELLGESNYANLPSSGINIEVINRKGSTSNQVLSKLAINTGVEYSLVWASVDRYRDSLFSFFTININEDDKDNVIRFLRENNIEWRII